MPDREGVRVHLGVGMNGVQGEETEPVFGFVCECVCAHSVFHFRVLGSGPQTHLKATVQAKDTV